MILLFFVFLFICSGSAAPEIRCIVVNLEYVNCTWDADGIPQENFSFKTSYSTAKAKVCPSYLELKGMRVGCVLPYDETKLQRFDELHAWLYREENILVAEHHRRLKNRVKLYPPCNLTVHLGDPDLWLYWNSSSRYAKSECQDREVRYRMNNKDWKVQRTVFENAFSVPFPNAQRLYEFQVRVRMAAQCSESELWSDWSKSVCWGSMLSSNDTETTQGKSALQMGLYTAGAVVLLIILACLLIRSERLRVILVPVVPRPSNLSDLINSYDGNVEKWLHISKELQDGFRPNFSERPCTVREFGAHQDQSESDTSYHTVVSSDYQLMQSYSSSSSPSSSPSSSTSLLSTDDTQK